MQCPIQWFIPALLAVALAACTTPLTTRYYTLQSAGPAGVAPTYGIVPMYSVAVGPVQVPDALDRKQIVLRTGPNRYVVSDADRWLEPLKSAIPRVVADAVALRLSGARVNPHVQHGGQDEDYAVGIDIRRLESVAGESAWIEADWRVRNRAGVLLREARFVRVEAVREPGVAALVAAHARVLNALGDDIAAAIAALSATSAAPPKP